MTTDTKKKETRLDKLLERKKQLENQIASVKAREKKEDGKRDTRKKILIGAFFMNQYDGRFDELVKLIDPFLTRDNDRELFGLKPIEKQEKNG